MLKIDEHLKLLVGKFVANELIKQYDSVRGPYTVLFLVLTDISAYRERRYYE